MKSYILARLLVEMANAMLGNPTLTTIESKDQPLKPCSKSSFKQNRRKQIAVNRAKKLKKLKKGVTK